MTKVFLLLQDSSLNNQIQGICNLNKIEAHSIFGELEDVLTEIHHETPDIIIIDNKFENCEFVIRQIKSASKNENCKLTPILRKSDRVF